MSSPFDWIKSINQKDYMYDLSGYVPYLTNRAFAMHIDTIMLSEEMNQAHELPPSLQYDFYYHSVRKGKRYGFPPKNQDPPNLDIVCKYFNYSKQKAIEALRLLSDEDLKSIHEKLDKGGRSK